jgi:hypothetical protein
MIITLVFEKNANFFAENWGKSQKIVIITSTPWSHWTRETFRRIWKRNQLFHKYNRPHDFMGPYFYSFLQRARTKKVSQSCTHGEVKHWTNFLNVNSPLGVNFDPLGIGEASHHEWRWALGELLFTPKFFSRGSQVHPEEWTNGYMSTSLHIASS